MSNQDVSFVLGELNGKMDLVLERLNQSDDAFETHIHRHDKRLKSLEKDRAKITGMALAISCAVTAGWQWLLGHSSN